MSNETTDETIQTVEINFTAGNVDVIRVHKRVLDKFWDNMVEKHSRMSLTDEIKHIWKIDTLDGEYWFDLGLFVSMVREDDGVIGGSDE